MSPAAGELAGARGEGGGVEARRVFIGAGCNRVVNNVSWGACGLVAFGAQNAVALFSPQRGEIVTTLPGHKAPVNCTLWLPTKKDVLQVRGRDTYYLLSGSADGTIMAWEIGSGKGDWSHVLQLPGMHKKGITCLAGRMVSDTVAIFASTSSDGIVVIWELVIEPTTAGSCKVSCLHSLSVGSKPMVSLSIAVLPEQGSHLVLAMGGLDHKIHIYCGDKSGKFIKACELKGVKESPSSNSSDGPDSMETIPDAVPTAQLAPVAEIWLWEVGTWKAVGRLQSHNLTVTQMEFSRDNAFLLSVSRDRHLSIFSIKKTREGVEHHLVAKHEAHKRIIWACSWNPFGYEFATGSRDKTVKIWRVQDTSSVKLLATLPQFRDSVTALAWMGRDSASNAGILAVGMDNGLIELWSVSGGRASAGDTSDSSPLIAACMLQFDPLMCHVSTVHRLRWREPDSSDEKSALELASCGADHCVRVFDVHCRTDQCNQI
nr:unnamed protein product [Digitaria exilis]